jgi:hypothetical protein
MPTPRFGFQTYLLGNKIYAIGGSQSQGTALATVEVYDPVADTWDITRADMPRRFTFFAGAVVNDKIYVIGGIADWITGGLEVWEYDPATVGVKTLCELPEYFVLEQNYPNPFNPTTAIRYQLPAAGEVTLAVYDLLGCEVSVLVNERRDAGVHEVNFDASGLASGVYLYRLQAGGGRANSQIGIVAVTGTRSGGQGRGLGSNSEPCLYQTQNTCVCFSARVYFRRTHLCLMASKT